MLAARDITRVWKLVRVNVDVLLQILILRKSLAAKIAHEKFDPNVLDHDMPPETELASEPLLAVIHGAGERGVIYLFVKHVLEKVVQKALLLAR